MSVEIYPVVHVNSLNQAIEQSALALDAGADGIYLIDHDNRSTDLLINSFNAVAEQSPASFVGVNFLQFGTAARSFNFLAGLNKNGDLARLPDGLWVDNADTDRELALTSRETHPELRGIQYLGGVAFKYTRLHTEDPHEAVYEAKRLMDYVDVVTTSGEGTGKAPSPEKIHAMKAAIGDKKLAVASGISIDNLADYQGSLDQLLVSTSIEVTPYSGVFVPKKLTSLVELAHEQ